MDAGAAGPGLSLYAAAISLLGSRMAKVGDTFAFPLTPREWLSGRVLLDLRAQCFKPGLVGPDSELGFFIWARRPAVA